MSFKEQLQEKTAEAEAIVLSYLPEEEGPQHLIYEAMNYSVKAGGKRLRPILIRETMRLFTEELQEGEPFMAAMECIHTYSLVHDDLPEMDDDALRRGLPTTHAKYGQAMGVLAGDALLNYAYEIIAGALTKSKHPYLAAVAFQILANCAGADGMVGGQVVDVLTEGQKQDKETLDFIYEKKTGALITAAMMIGAILGGADEKELVLIEEAAGAVGIAFQIQDDILDVTSTEEILGKPILSDEKNHKDTYVTLLGLEAAGKEVERLSALAIENLNKLEKDSDFLVELVTYLIHREK